MAYVMRHGNQGWRDLQEMDLKTFNRIFAALSAMVAMENKANRS